MNKEDYFKYYIQGSDHYLIPKDVFDELFEEMESWKEDTQKLEKENKELKEDISFCLHSIKQEMEMSTDSRTRNEMTSCYEILKRWSK